MVASPRAHLVWVRLKVGREAELKGRSSDLLPGWLSTWFISVGSSGQGCKEGRGAEGQQGRGSGGSQKGWGCSSVLVLLWERNRAEQRGRRGVSQRAAQGTGILAGLTPLWDYLSLSRGGLGGVEHLLPPLHPRHGLHVLAPITHLHGALLPGGWDSGDTGWDQSTGSPTTPRPTAQSPAHGQPLPCCRCPLHQSSALGVWMWGWPRGW